MVLATGGLWSVPSDVARSPPPGCGPMERLRDRRYAGWGTWIIPWWVRSAPWWSWRTVVAYVSGIVATRALGSKVAAFISLTEVLFAVLWAWLLLGELPLPVQMLGGAFIVGGVLLVRADEPRGDRVPASDLPAV